MTIESLEKLLNQVKNGMSIDKALDALLRDRKDSERWHWLFYAMIVLVSAFVAVLVTVAIMGMDKPN